MEAIAKSLELLYTWFALVGVRNDKRNPNFCPFCLKSVTLSTPIFGYSIYNCGTPMSPLYIPMNLQSQHG